MVRIRLIFLLFIAYSSLYSQEFVNDSSRSVDHSIFLESGMLISAKDRLPFWLSVNNSGRFTVESANSIYQLIDYRGAFDPLENLRVSWQIESLINAREDIQGRIILANVGVETKFLKISGGYHEELFGLNDSTLSIGNLVYGNNARPIPKFIISTNGWQKAPFFKNHLSFQAYLAHGQFEQERFQSGAFLHQKYFYFKTDLFKNKLSLIGGLHHNAQWGGSNSQNESSQPIGLKNYMRIAMGSSGGNDALLTDQRNALGNHLGTYDMRGSFEFKNFVLSNYWQFLWEDKSGLTPFNWRDGLMGASIDFKKGGIIKKAVLEIIRTNDQNAQKVGDDGTPIFEPDSFFNNSVYRSGWSYHNEVIGNPVFLILNKESISGSRIKNSINAINIGISGQVGKLGYRINYIDFKNKGTKQEIISPSLKIKAINLDLAFRLSKTANLNALISYQEANFGSQRNVGIQMSYTKNFKF